VHGSTLSPRFHRASPRIGDEHIAMTAKTLTYPADKVPSIRQVMMPRDTNALGTIFGGVILSQVDLAAAIEAHKSHPARIVTVSMDKVEFKQPVFVGDLVSCFTETTRVGRTSITVRVSVWAQRRFGGGEFVHVTEANVTMVAVDDEFKPTPILRPRGSEAG
jgi:acyl-CoA thioesterase YciA